MSLIELKNVTKGFYLDARKSRAAVAVDGIDLSIERGEFVSLIGPSGCGKTVTLNMMAGFMEPTMGDVLFKGSPVTKPGPERGVVFQEYSLLPWLSVKQNVLFAQRNCAKAAGIPYDARQAGRRAEEALANVNLADAANRRPNTLSGGMKQRVAIARLLAMDSEVFLMDEPFSALDEQTRAGLDASLFDLWRQKGKTVVFVTHNISEAVLVSSRIVLFSAAPGKIIGEWALPPDLDRNLDNPALRQISGEIRSQLPLSPTTFSAAGSNAGGVSG